MLFIYFVLNLSDFIAITQIIHAYLGLKIGVIKKVLLVNNKYASSQCSIAMDNSVHHFIYFRSDILLASTEKKNNNDLKRGKGFYLSDYNLKLSLM